MEDLLRIIQQATGYFLTSFDQVNDITNEKERRRIYQIITSTLEQLGQQVAEVVPSSIVDEYTAGFAEAGALMVSGGAANVRGNLTTAVHVEAVQFLAQATVDDLQASFRTASTLGIANIEMDLKEIQDKMAQGILVGSAKRVTTTRVQKAFREKGLTSFITSDNKKLPLDFYAMTVVRTKQKQAQIQGAVNRYKENGVKYIQIGERHPTCKVCASRNGLIVAFEPNDEGVPTVDEIGGLPPFHPNCRHTIRPIMSLEGRDIRPFRETDPRTPAQRKAYDLEQKIRVKANAEKKQFRNLQAALGDRAPKNIGAFRRMKRANNQEWKDLQSEYRNVIGRMERGRAINPTLRFEKLPPLENAKAWTPETSAFGQDTITQLKEGNSMYTLGENAERLFPEFKKSRLMNPKTGNDWDQEAMNDFFNKQEVTIEGLANIYNPDKSKYSTEIRGIKLRKTDQGMSEFDFKIEIKDINDRNNKIASLSRTMYKTQGRYFVHNNYLQVEPDFQGGDIATKLYFKQEVMMKYFAQGQPINITMTANLSVGKYAWSRHGFDFKDENEHKTYGTYFKKFAEEVIGVKDFVGYLNKLGYNSIEDIKHSWQFGALDDGEKHDMETIGQKFFGSEENIKGQGNVGKKFMLCMGQWEGRKRVNQGHDSETIGNLYYQAKGIK
jgi:SPP1 gp7 family putative phage head morphogenesis protein